MKLNSFSEEASDLIRIQQLFAGDDVAKEIIRRCFLRSKSDTINAHTVYKVMDELIKEGTPERFDAKEVIVHESGGDAKYVLTTNGEYKLKAWKACGGDTWYRVNTSYKSRHCAGFRRWISASVVSDKIAMGDCEVTP